MNDHLKPKGYEKKSWLQIARLFPDKYEIIDSYDPKHDQRLSPNGEADPQPGQRPQNETGTVRTLDDAKTAPLTAVGSSALFGSF